jgi:hypothetical protein
MEPAMPESAAPLLPNVGVQAPLDVDALVDVDVPLDVDALPDPEPALAGC